ncbi:dimethylsulfonioproprionate lyase family protein [Alteromonas lipotrueiana]|uniref:dimethylsulfonioproprionate lyase family protein n=1 Tax=Alteromonas lipotrueiana TaxID=2803815 RepID=UPI001C4894EA|nr:dimethylsulfonioproprionate lyase family protein [Alteromonas lipotrueiana]
MNKQVKRYIAGAQLLMFSSLSIATDFVCDENIDTTTQNTKESQILWQQTLTYLRGVKEILTKKQGCEAGPLAITETNNGSANIARDCTTGYRDVQKVIKHVDAVLANPNAAKACFDSQKNYDALALYTANEELKVSWKVAGWLDRPTLTEFYDKKSGDLKKAGLTLANEFWSIVTQSHMPDYLETNITANALPELWAAVGWLPFYADAEKAHNDRFRGGYTYAEVMGPWGLLRIKSINGESVGAELGMTIQLSDTFYPYHYHHPQEFYLPLTTPSCGTENRFFAAHSDSALFEHSSEDSSFIIDANQDTDLPAWFVPKSPNGNYFTYFERNTVHAFDAAPSCDETASGIVSIWGRTTARDNVQTTQICEVIEQQGGERKAEPHSRYRCKPTQWDY